MPNAAVSVPQPVSMELHKGQPEDRSGSGVVSPTRQEGARGVENRPVARPQHLKHTTSWSGEKSSDLTMKAYLPIHSVPG